MSQLIRSVFRQGTLSPNFEFSPVTSLAQSLGATTIATPCKRLSLSSLTSESSCDIDIPFDFDDASVWHISPDKENQIIPAISRKRRRSSETPLRQIQNRPCERSPSPKYKKARQHSAMKCGFTSADSPMDKDSSSRDSGYSESETKHGPLMSLPKPVLPKLNLDSSPTKMEYLESPTKEREFRTFASLSGSFADDEFLMDLISDTPKPTNFNNLMSAPFTSETPEPIPRNPIRRCLSMFESSTPVIPRTIDTVCYRRMEVTPTGPLAVSSPRRDVQSYQFKRPCSPVACHVLTKRRKLNSDCSPFKSVLLSTKFPMSVPLKSPTIQRSISDSHLAIMKALNKSDYSEELTGDFSRPLALPILSGCKHPDLRSISSDSLASLLRGGYSDSVASYSIIDCRYPYEYNGGHINGALNWPNLEYPSKYFDSVSGTPKIAPVESGRKIIIFHCEFSAERGPRAQRYLREVDRTVHKEQYPALHFPELYLLEGGYKAFFNSYPELCMPHSYVRMLDGNYSEDMKLCRAQSKTFANETKFGKGRCTVSRTNSSKRREMRLLN